MNLKFAARSLQEDIDKSGREKQELFNEVTQRGKTAYKRAACKRPDASSSHLTMNQYEVLSDSDQEKEIVVSASEHAVPTGQTRNTARDTRMICKHGKATNSEAEISKRKIQI